MRNNDNVKEWAGYLAPKEELLGYVRQFLTEVNSCQTIHYSFTSTHPRPPERHAVNFHFCLTWIFEGTLWVSAAFERHWERRAISAGQLLLSGTGGWYEPDIAAADSRSLSILFYPRHTRLVYADMRHGQVVDNPYYHTSRPTEGLGQALLKILNQLLQEPPQVRHDRVLSISRALLQQLIVDLERDSHLQFTAQDRLISQIATYCQQCFHLPVNVAYICQRLKISNSYASELFHRTTGQMLKDYLLALRMEKAEWLLNVTDRPLEEIAVQCGFSGANYFVRVFHQTHGIPPGIYRKKVKTRSLRPVEPDLSPEDGPNRLASTGYFTSP